MASTLIREVREPEYNIEDFVMMESGEGDRSLPMDFRTETLCRSDLIAIAEKSLYRYGKICATDESPKEHIERAIAALHDAMGSLQSLLEIEKTTEGFVDHPKKPRHMYLTKDRRIAWNVP